MTVRCPSIQNSEKVASLEATQCEDAYSSMLVFIPRITITQTRLIFMVIVIRSIECNGKGLSHGTCCFAFPQCAVPRSWRVLYQRGPQKKFWTIFSIFPSRPVKTSSRVSHDNFLRLFRHYDVDFLSHCISCYIIVVEENEILYLEGKYNKLRASSNSGRFDIELFRRLVSPPLPQTLTDSKLSSQPPSDCAPQSIL